MISRQLTDGHMQTQNTVYGHDTTSTSSSLFATILVFWSQMQVYKKKTQTKQNTTQVSIEVVYNNYMQVYI